jgi:hypothetical protein
MKSSLSMAAEVTIEETSLNIELPIHSCPTRQIGTLNTRGFEGAQLAVSCAGKVRKGTRPPPPAAPEIDIRPRRRAPELPMIRKPAGPEAAQTFLDSEACLGVDAGFSFPAV